MFPFKLIKYGGYETAKNQVKLSLKFTSVVKKSSSSGYIIISLPWIPICNLGVVFLTSILQGRSKDNKIMHGHNNSFSGPKGGWNSICTVNCSLWSTTCSWGLEDPQESFVSRAGLGGMRAKNVVPCNLHKQKHFRRVAALHKWKMWERNPSPLHLYTSHSFRVLVSNITSLFSTVKL